jgi:hypothetical protein
MLVACDWVSIRHETGIRLEYKSTRNVPVLKEASSYTAILAGSTFLLILSSVVELSRRSNSTHGGRKSYRGRIVAVSATPEAAHILTFAHTVRPEIRMEFSANHAGLLPPSLALETSRRYKTRQRHMRQFCHWPAVEVKVQARRVQRIVGQGSATNGIGCDAGQLRPQTCGEASKRRIIPAVRKIPPASSGTSRPCRWRRRRNSAAHYNQEEIKQGKRSIHIHWPCNTRRNSP